MFMAVDTTDFCQTRQENFGRNSVSVSGQVDGNRRVVAVHCRNDYANRESEHDGDHEKRQYTGEITPKRDATQARSSAVLLDDAATHRRSMAATALSARYAGPTTTVATAPIARILAQCPSSHSP
jgi:hypothetical protein